MNYIYLDAIEARDLFLNKYLKKKRFNRGTRKKSGKLSFHLGSAQELHLVAEFEIVFLSQFDYVYTDSIDDFRMYVQNYSVPVGFFKADKNKSKLNITFNSREDQITIDKTYLITRRSLLNTFIKFYKKEDAGIEHWFEYYKNDNILPQQFLGLFEELLGCKDFPFVTATGKLTKKPIEVLQFIKLGNYLKDHFFDKINIVFDENHKNWLNKLSPDSEIKVLEVPIGFKNIAEIIIGYILAIKAKKEIHSMINHNSISYEDDCVLNLSLIDFYQAFWEGSLKQNLDNYFHIEDSSHILTGIEVKAYQIAYASNTLNYTYSADVISNTLKSKDQKRGQKIRYNKYCELIAGEKPVLKTKRDLLEIINHHDITNINLLIFFLSSDKYLYRVKEIVTALGLIKEILIVYKYSLENKPEQTKIKLDVFLSDLKNEITSYGNGLNVEVLGKNKNNNDDRDIINNIKAILKKQSTNKHFLYATDEPNPSEKEVEMIWLGKAYSSTPLFDDKEDYLFVYQ